MQNIPTTKHFHIKTTPLVHAWLLHAVDDQQHSMQVSAHTCMPACPRDCLPAISQFVISVVPGRLDHTRRAVFNFSRLTYLAAIQRCLIPNWWLHLSEIHRCVSEPEVLNNSPM